MGVDTRHDHRHRLPSRLALLGLPAFILTLGFVATALAINTAVPQLTKGPIPDNAFLSDGSIDASLVPDFVSVTGGDSIVGYVRKELVLSPTMDGADWPVYASDLKTLVGHMVADKGFVPLGVDRDSVQPIHASEGPAMTSAGLGGD